MSARRSPKPADSIWGRGITPTTPFVGGSASAVPAEPWTPHSERLVARARPAKA